MQHRADIQIMRGVAVLLVVLFHLGVTGFSAGFLGVDAFFVISGFLMAILYPVSRGGGDGAVLSFYRRRARRLLPAYVATVALTVLASAFLTLPSEHEQVVEQGLYASGLLSNFGFWAQNSYFSKAEFNPLLHLWSLGVEFQFYLFVPLIVWLHSRTRLLVLAIALGSLAAALVMVTISPKTSFFMMPLRLWQFLAGAGVAWHLSRAGNVLQPRPLLGAVALVVVVLVAILWPVDGETPGILWGHPGLAALVVTIAAAVLLACGLPSGFESSRVGRVLHGIGDWSYAIYLAHFPVLVIGLYRPFSGTILDVPGWSQGLVLVTLIVLGSALLHLVFERPRLWSGNLKAGAIMLAAAAVLTAVSGPLSRVRFDTTELNILGAFQDRAVYRCGKLSRILSPRATLCEVTSGLPADAPAAVLVGDSHADAVKVSFARVAQERGVRLYLTVSNSPVYGFPRPERLLADIRAVGARDIILHFASSNALRAWETGIQDAAAADGFDLFWLLPVPNFDTSVPEMLWEARSRLPLPGQPVNLAAVDTLRDHLAQDNVPTADPWPSLCAESCLLSDAEAHPLYFDGGHLTLTGARYLEGVMNTVFDHFTDTPR